MIQDKLSLFLNDSQELESTVPVNRRPKPTLEKQSELVDAATDLFIRDGYEASSMAKIAKQAGVTSNTIYWYFKDKDELLLAVLNQLLAKYYAQLPERQDQTLAEQLIWLVQILNQYNRLLPTLHARIKISAALNQWHSNFHQLIDALVEASLNERLPPSCRQAELRILTYTLEGLVTHGDNELQVRKTCENLAARLNSLGHS